MEKISILKCHRIIQKLISRPITKPFLQAESITPNFAEIQNKIYTNQYSSITQFSSDIASVFKSMYNFSKTNIFLNMCVDDLQNYYKKLFSKNLAKTKLKLSFVSLCNRMTNNINDAPEILIELKERTSHSKTEPFYPPLSPLELELLSEAINKKSE